MDEYKQKLSQYKKMHDLGCHGCNKFRNERYFKSITRRQARHALKRQDKNDREN